MVRAEESGGFLCSSMILVVPVSIPNRAKPFWSPKMDGARGKLILSPSYESRTHLLIVHSS